MRRTAPSAIAQTTSEAPRWASPQTNTPVRSSANLIRTPARTPVEFQAQTTQQRHVFDTVETDGQQRQVARDLQRLTDRRDGAPPGPGSRVTWTSAISMAPQVAVLVAHESLNGDLVAPMPALGVGREVRSTSGHVGHGDTESSRSSGGSGL